MTAAVLDPDALARRMLDQAVTAPARPVGGGANSRVWRIMTAAGPVALKLYPPGQPERLSREVGGLAFLTREVGMIDAVPRPLAADREIPCAVFQWIAGVPVARFEPAARTPQDVAALLRLLDRLAAAARRPDAAALPAAAEACPSAAALIDQVDRRRHRLAAVAERDPALADFLADRFDPLWARATARLAALEHAGNHDPAPRARTLSPADCGFHNAVRRDDGSLAFLDFEYFGWDDPVKLISDVLWHPGMVLSAAERAAILAGGARLFGDRDPGFGARLASRFPLFGLRWVMILLNEFLPERWHGRVHAGARDWAAARRRQLGKAERWAAGVDGAVRIDGPLDAVVAAARATGEE